MKTSTYCVIYRTGGTANGKWHRTIAYQTREIAENAAADNRRAGYESLVVDYEHSLRAGLPDGDYTTIRS